MPIELLIKGFYPDQADALFQRASHFSDLVNGSTGALTFKGLPAVQMEEGTTYTADVSAFGVIKQRDYQIRIDRLCQCAHVLETTQTSALIRSCHHHIQIKPTPTGSVWIDRITIEAGLVTPILSYFAAGVLRQRHNKRSAECVDMQVGKSYRSIRSELPMYQAAE
jgi:hypothetical protein